MDEAAQAQMHWQQRHSGFAAHGREFRGFVSPDVLLNEIVPWASPETRLGFRDAHGQWLKAVTDNGWEPLSPVSYEALQYVACRELARMGRAGQETRAACTLFFRPLADTALISGPPAEPPAHNPGGLIGALRRALGTRSLDTVSTPSARSPTNSGLRRSRAKAIVSSPVGNIYAASLSTASTSATSSLKSRMSWNGLGGTRFSL